MGMYVNTNTAANNAYRNLNTNQTALNKSLEKLSSGLRINRAADDAAGLAISEGMKSQIGGLTVAATNAQDGVNVIQTAEGGLSQAQSILQRLRDLAVQGANDSNNADSRGAIKTEAKSLTDELSRIAGSTNFGNNKNLLDGTAGTMNFQVAANQGADSKISVNLGAMDLNKVASALGSTGAGGGYTFAVTAPGGTYGSAYNFTVDNGSGTKTEVAATFGTAATSAQDLVDKLNADAGFSAKMSASVVKNADGVVTDVSVTANGGGTVAGGTIATAGAAGTNLGSAVAPTGTTGGLDFSSTTAAQASIALLDNQITTISTNRATLGATQNRLESAIATINISKENLSAASSRITDTDMASEMVKYTRSSILSQAGTAMLAQANQSNQGVLKLLQ